MNANTMNEYLPFMVKTSKEITTKYGAFKVK